MTVLQILWLNEELLKTGKSSRSIIGGKLQYISLLSLVILLLGLTFRVILEVVDSMARKGKR